jgi:hypothetical protein
LCPGLPRATLTPQDENLDLTLNLAMTQSQSPSVTRLSGGARTPPSPVWSTFLALWAQDQPPHPLLRAWPPPGPHSLPIFGAEAEAQGGRGDCPSRLAGPPATTDHKASFWLHAVCSPKSTRDRTGRKHEVGLNPVSSSFYPNCASVGEPSFSTPLSSFQKLTGPPPHPRPLPGSCCGHTSKEVSFLSSISSRFWVGSQKGWRQTAQPLVCSVTKRARGPVLDSQGCL